MSDRKRTRNEREQEEGEVWCIPNSDLKDMRPLWTNDGHHHHHRHHSRKLESRISNRE